MWRGYGSWRRASSVAGPNSQQLALHADLVDYFAKTSSDNDRYRGVNAVPLPFSRGIYSKIIPYIASI